MRAHKSKPVILFSITKSADNTSQKGRFTHFSLEKSKWEKLPKEVLLVGDKTKSRFAIVAKNLKPINKTLNLGEYCSYAGVFPDPNKYLDGYFKYRVDKACGYYLPRQGTGERNISIQYSGELVEPYSVYIK